MDNKLKHLEFIQGAINRLATNSFRMKGWTVVLVAAILVLLARENRPDTTYIALAPILIFWALETPTSSGKNASTAPSTTTCARWTRNKSTSP